MSPEEIKAFRKSKGLTQSDLGRLCGVGKGSVSDWEAGKNQPSGGARLLLEEYLSGERCLVPLSAQEENLLDENVRKGGFSSREAFLAASLIHLIKYGGFGEKSPPAARR